MAPDDTLPTIATHRVVAKIALPIDVAALSPLLLAFGKKAVVITDGPLFEDDWMIVAEPAQ